MISDLQVATADDGKRIVLYPLEITLWDFYALSAMQALLTAAHMENGGMELGNYGEEKIADWSAEMADAMLAKKAERAK